MLVHWHWLATGHGLGTGRCSHKLGRSLHPGSALPIDWATSFVASTSSSWWRPGLRRVAGTTACRLPRANVGLLKAAYFMEDLEKVHRETQGSPGILAQHTALWPQGSLWNTGLLQERLAGQWTRPWCWLGVSRSLLQEHMELVDLESLGVVLLLVVAVVAAAAAVVVVAAAWPTVQGNGMAITWQ